MKKVLIAILCSILILGSGFSVTAAIDIDKLTDYKKVITNDDFTEMTYKNLNITNFTGFLFQSSGPKKLSFVGLTVDNGTFFNRTMLMFSFFGTSLIRIMLLGFPFVRPNLLFVSDVDFTLEYKRDNLRGNLSRNRYTTFYQYYEEGNATDQNTTIQNEKHTIKLEGFTGAILLTKRSLFSSPRISIFGGADNVTLVE